MNNWLIKLGIGLFVLVLSTIAVSPFFFMVKPEGGRRWQDYRDPYNENEVGTNNNSLHIPETHDMRLHFDQMRSFYVGLSAGVLYPRWLEDANRGFGAPTMNYYSPGIYYVTS